MLQVDIAGQVAFIVYRAIPAHARVMMYGCFAQYGNLKHMWIMIMIALLLQCGTGLNGETTNDKAAQVVALLLNRVFVRSKALGLASPYSPHLKSSKTHPHQVL